MAKPIKEQTSFLGDTFRRYLSDSPDKIKRGIMFEEGHHTVDPFSVDLLMEGRQGYLNESIDYLTPDPEFNWVQQAEEDNLTKFLPHMSNLEIKNRQQYDVAKRHMEEINENAYMINQSDRFWGPLIAAQFMQMETYALIPFTFGSGIGIASAIKGGAKLAAANVITEIPREHTRQYYDPYYNETHSMTVFGLSGAVGGIMGFLPPAVRGAAKAYRSKGIGQASIYDDMPNDKLVKESFEQWDQKYNGGIELEFELKIPGITRNVGYKTTTGTGKYINLNTGKVLDASSKRSRRLNKNDLYIPVKLTNDKNGRQIIEVDDAWMEMYYTRFKQGKNVPNIPPEFNKFIKTKSDFRNYLIRKEVYRDLDYVENLPKNIKERELMFNAKVMDDLIDENQMSFQTREMLPPIDINNNYFKIDINPVNILNRMMEKVSPLTKYNKALSSDKKLYFKSNHLIHSLLNDNGLKLKASNRGIQINDSVVTSRDVIWGKHHLNYEDEMNGIYLDYLGKNKDYNKLNKSLAASKESLMLSAENTIKETKDKVYNIKNKILGRPEFDNLGIDETYKTHMIRSDFNLKVQELMSDVNKFENSTNPQLREAVIARRKYYKKYADVIESEDMMGQKPLIKQFKIIQERLPRLQNKINKSKSPGQKHLYQQVYNDLKQRLTFLDDIFDIQDGIVTPKKITDFDVSKTGILPMNETHQTFFHRVYNREAWINNPEKGKLAILKDMLTYSPNKDEFLKMADGEVNSIFLGATRNHVKLSKEVDKKYNHIVNKEAANGDELNMLEMGSDKKVNPTMHRTLYGPNKSFMADENGGVNFLIDDAIEADRIYQQQMGTAIQMNRIFGDKTGFFKKQELIEDIADRMNIEAPKANIENIFPFVRDIKKKVTGKLSIDEVNGIIRNFEDQVNNLYGLHNRIPAEQLTKRVVENVMNYTVSTTMGNAGMSGMAEMGRRTTVHGMKKAGMFPGSGRIGSGTYGKSYSKLNQEMRKAIDKEASEYYTHMEIIASQGYLSRLVNTDMGAIHKSVDKSPLTFKNALSKTVNKAEQLNRGAARATYILNGQTHLTHFLKESHAGMSSHYFIKDLLSLHKGKLSAEGIDRLKQYGLGPKQAKIVNDINEKGIIERVSADGRDDLFLSRIDRWTEVKGGDDIQDAFRNAIKQDVEVSIVTPGYSSKPNMMYGRIQIDNQTVADFLGESKLLKNLNKYSGGAFGEFHSLGRGGIYENALLMFPLQFYSFSLGASRYILRNLPTNQGLYAGVTAAMAYTWLANHMKYGWYGDLDIDQQLFMAFETSGVGGVFSDLPRVIETETQGRYGLRRMLGIDELEFMEDQDRRGATMIGIGPQKLRELFGAMAGGDDLEKSGQFARNLPFQNNIIFKRGWQLLGGKGNPYSPIGDLIFDVDRDKIKKRGGRRKMDRFKNKL